MADDKKTIGLTPANNAVMDRLVETAGFKLDMDAAKFAFALAVNRGRQPGTVKEAGTIWNVGSFDGGGELRTLIENLYPGSAETPYRALESLINEGFGLIASLQEQNPTLRVDDLLKDHEPGGSPAVVVA